MGLSKNPASSTFKNMWNCINILSDRQPDIRRLNKRLSSAFIFFGFFGIGGVGCHLFWALETREAANFARGGSWLLAVSLISFGFCQSILAAERWRYEKTIEQNGNKVGDHFLQRHYLEITGRLYNGISLVCAAVGTIISGYGDLWVKLFL